MQRIERIDPARAPPRSAALLATVRRQMGGVPNLLTHYLDHVAGTEIGFPPVRSAEPVAA